jgi:hypothetical protein
MACSHSSVIRYSLNLHVQRSADSDPVSIVTGMFKASVERVAGACTLALKVAGGLLVLNLRALPRNHGIVQWHSAASLI